MAASRIPTLILFNLVILLSCFSSVHLQQNKSLEILKVIHLSDSKNEENFKSLCAIDIFTEKTSSNITYDKYFPFHFHNNVSLCSNQNFPINDYTGYHSFKYTNDCSVDDQIKKFVKLFAKIDKKSFPKGIVFSTPCYVNISCKFRINEDVQNLVDKYEFDITVIDSGKARNLSSYDRMKTAKTHDSSFSYLPMVIMLIIATLTVFVGSLWSGIVRHQIYLSTSKDFIPIESDNSKSKDASNHQEPAYTNVSVCSVITLVVCMITALLLLYFFYNYLVYFILFLFLITTMTSLYICMEAVSNYLLPPEIISPNFKYPSFLCLKGSKLRYFDIFLIVIAIAIPIMWFAIRHRSNSWLLQDFLGFIFCINMLRTLRLPSLKICTYLLCILFVYDIFFVFITPLFTSKGQSIMVEVATGGSRQANYFEYRCEGSPSETLPMIFRVPRKLFGFDPFDFYDVCAPKSDSILGYGDVMIPGLLIAYCSAFDRVQNIPYHLYFVVSMISYALGLIVTFAALALMKGAAQPALLYLVPFTLLPLVFIALCRKEFKAFWNGPEKNLTRQSIPENGDN